MSTSRVLSSLLVALALTGCGGDEPHKTAPPPPAAPKPAPPPAAAANKPAASAPAGPPQTACLGKWTSGTTGTVTCSPPKGAAFDKAAFRLDRVCVNDPRITTYTAAGKAVTLTLKPEGKLHCATLSGVAEVPESCTCVAPAAGDCNPPADGFVCVAIGHFVPAGG
jgi:hypothetical protein